MPTFPNYNPDSSSDLTVTPRVLSADFGDNYSQQQKDGLNAFDEKWNLQFNKRDKVIIQEIKTFLDTVSDVTPFDWKAPDDTVSKKWRKKGDYKMTTAGADKRNISFTIVRYFGV